MKARVQFSEEKKKNDLKQLKEGTVSKIKTDVRTKDPLHIKMEDAKKKDTVVVKRKFSLNKLSQVRKMVFKNKTVAPVSVAHHTNDVLVRYSPAVFKNAVEAVTDKWQDGNMFESDKLKLKVMKRRSAVDQSDAKLDSLVHFKMSAKNKVIE